MKRFTMVAAAAAVVLFGLAPAGCAQAPAAGDKMMEKKDGQMMDKKDGQMMDKKDDKMGEKK